LVLMVVILEGGGKWVFPSRDLGRCFYWGTFEIRATCGGGWVCLVLRRGGRLLGRGVNCWVTSLALIWG